MMKHDKSEQDEKITYLLDSVKTLVVMIAATLIGYIFLNFGFTDANIIMIYILCVLVTAVITSHYIYGIISSVVSVLLFYYLFTEPKFSLMAYDRGYPITFVIMLIAAVITSTLAIKLKNHARESAKAAMAARNEQIRANLLRAISHDLRTPLTSISGNADNLLSNGSSIDDETRKRIYNDIYDDSVWLINLVENLLSVTRIEDGRMKLNISAELMEEIIAEALRHVSRKKTEHIIKINSTDEFILAKVDARLIVQVVINIVDNAIKYTPKGSEIEINTSKENGEVAVTISDDGPGISDDMKEHVFDMFYSGANKIVDSRRSLGLGLSLCKSIITAHGGTITVFDNKPKGTVFKFTLPAEEVKL